ncbi:MAG: alkaline phosphatase [Chthoniobacterales bacterium]
MLALFCLVAFAAFGVFYFRHWVVQKPFGIILFVGEGLTPGRLAPTRIYAGGVDVPLALDVMPHVALVENFSSDFATPDRAAAAMAIATGLKVNNRSLNAEVRGSPVPSLLDLAQRGGRATGLITDGRITNPTAATFYTSKADPSMQSDIAREFADNPHIDLVLGGGAQDFVPETKDGSRKDSRDLLADVRHKGFDLVRTKAELEAVPGWKRPKLFGAFSGTELAYADQIEARAEQPSLSDMVRRAIELLQYNRGGYLLVVDAHLMRKAAEQNDAEHTLLETVELDRAVAVARRYAGAKATIIVCGDVGVGGLHLNGSPFRTDRGMSVLGLNSSGDPWLSWATGPNGSRSYGAAKLAARQSPTASPFPTPEAPQEPAAFFAPAALDTLEDVAAFGAGPGSEALAGVVESTAIFRIIRDLL